MTQKQLFDDEKAESAQNVVSVLVPYPIDKAYDYVVSDGEDYQPGDYVIVPLGGREISAVVWGDAAGDVDPRKLKSIVAKHKAKPMVKAVRDFIDWVADYTLTPRGFVLKMALSVPAGLDPPKPAKGYEIERDVGDVKLTEKQGFVRDVLSDGVARIAADIAREAGVSSGVVKGVLGKGIIKEVDIFNPAPCKKPDPFLDGFDLSEDQSSVADILIKGVKAEAYQAYLLDGVTGAGKTEVYFEAVAAALKKG
ncbi:MAG: hypothetical protein AB8B83_05310 [Bdellovibrionales bacterium]